jgi:energy-coupling factor transporter ATP-binding protein EcfA2
MISGNPRLERLQLTAFRGATRPTAFQFQGDRPLILIFGENGAGKSTLADAIDFLCNNDFGSLALKSGVRPARHIVSVNARPGDLSVEMVYGGQRWRAFLKGAKPVTTPAEPRPPRPFVLRRADITRIMEATDSQRYKSLQPFITAPRIERAEAELRKASNAVAKQVDAALQQKGSAEAMLKELWIAEGRPGENFLAWARTAVRQPVATLETRIAGDRARLNALDQALEADRVVTVQAARLDRTRWEYAELNRQFQQASQAQAEADLLETLQAAQAYLQGHADADRCPVCAKPEPRSALLARLDAQLAQLEEVQRLRRRLETKLEEGHELRGAYDAALQARRGAYADLLIQLQESPDALPPDIPVAAVDFTDDPAAEAEARATLDALTAYRPSMERRVAEAEHALGRHSAFSAHLAAIDRWTDVLLETYTLDARLKAMLAIMEEERKRYVEQTVEGISGAVGRLYSRIHPGEPLGDLRFGLKQKTKGSLTLTGAFGPVDAAPPGAYYSDAHLDTLGLCVYLALARQAGDALVVLDDVLATLDGPHLDRVMALIAEEAPAFGQVIITTHDRAWFERAGQSGGVQAELVELAGWDLQEGMTG